MSPAAAITGTPVLAAVPSGVMPEPPGLPPAVPASPLVTVNMKPSALDLSLTRTRRRPGAERGNGQMHREPSPAARSRAPGGTPPNLMRTSRRGGNRAPSRRTALPDEPSPGVQRTRRPRREATSPTGRALGSRGNHAKHVHDASPFASRDDPPLAGSQLGNGEGGPERSAAAGACPCDHLIAHADHDPVALAQVTPHEVHLTARETGGGAQRHPALRRGRLGERSARSVRPTRPTATPSRFPLTRCIWASSWPHPEITSAGEPSVVHHDPTLQGKRCQRRGCRDARGRRDTLGVERPTSHVRRRSRNRTLLRVLAVRSDAIPPHNRVLVTARRS